MAKALSPLPHLPLFGLPPNLSHQGISYTGNRKIKPPFGSTRKVPKMTPTPGRPRPTSPAPSHSLPWHAGPQCGPAVPDRTQWSRPSAKHRRWGRRVPPSFHAGPDELGAVTHTRLRSRYPPFAQCPGPHTTMERHPGPIQEQWAGQTSSQDERSHVGQRRPGIDPLTSSLVLSYSLKKAF